MDHALNDYVLALQLLGAKVKIEDHLVVATHGKARVSFWLSDKYGIFGWGYPADGSETYVFSFDQIRQALGLTGYVRSSTILIRAFKTLGMTNRGVIKNFRVHGEYNQARERIRTIADFYGKDNEKAVVEHWDELKPALDLTGYRFKLHDCAGTFHYVSN